MPVLAQAVSQTLDEKSPFRTESAEVKRFGRQERLEVRDFAIPLGIIRRPNQIIEKHQTSLLHCGRFIYFKWLWLHSPHFVGPSLFSKFCPSIQTCPQLATQKSHMWDSVSPQCRGGTATGKTTGCVSEEEAWRPHICSVCQANRFE